MVLALSLRDFDTPNIELEGITPAAVAGKSLQQISRLPIFCGRNRPQLGELFEVTGGADSDCIQISGDLRHVHWIGCGMKAGAIEIDGPVGRHAGSGMAGGSLTIRGDAGDWLGAEMSGGRIELFGNAGDLAGAGYRGAVRGMTGGELLIRGDAGDETGLLMRRGLIAVTGNVGVLAGCHLIAGSIVVGGKCGARIGAGMKRGTIVLTGQHPAPPMLPGFQESGLASLQIMRVMGRRLAAWGLAEFQAAADAPFRMIRGDRIVGGLGEILIADHS